MRSMESTFATVAEPTRIDALELHLDRVSAELEETKESNDE